MSLIVPSKFNNTNGSIWGDIVEQNAPPCLLFLISESMCFSSTIFSTICLNLGSKSSYAFKTVSHSFVIIDFFLFFDF